ncbi:hypothetical protein Celaphus_00003398 [Cervus elaphus hippelaphus]|uniref:UDENN FNIP1/2-type domain-containing protein n=1 Tax=Cervus elaphus hippelaphus TaxID=46360 RepID=A0A212D005_CEREH|nr:hypothetical protein Celaphus_00003398 [Cervus elaphus hippelaphus]
MKMSRRSADASQRSLAYNRIVDALNEFRICPLTDFSISGDLYGAIGSPVRLARTVVVGKRQDMVQRLLYFLTYFIRCSELQETHLLENGEDEAIVMPGTVITTTLEKGEIEESEYVLITMHRNKSSLLFKESEETRTPNCNCKYCSRPLLGQHTENVSRQEREDIQNSSKELLGISNECQMISPDCQEENAPGVKQYRDKSRTCLDTKLETVVCTGSAPVDRCALSKSGLDPAEETWQNEELLDSGSHTGKVLRSAGMVVEKKPPDKLVTAAFSCEATQTKVTFLIGDSMSPDSDTELRSQAVVDQITRHHTKSPQEERGAVDQHQESKQTTKSEESDIPNTVSGEPCELPCWNHSDLESMSLFDEYFNDDSIETRTIDDIPLKTSTDSKQHCCMLEFSKRLCTNNSKPNNEFCKCVGTVHQDSCKTCFPQQDQRDTLSILVPHGDKESSEKKIAVGAEWDIPRNESSDSALGDSESEDTGQDVARQGNSYYGGEQEDWAEEDEIPFPGSKLIEVSAVQPNIANFGRSLLGGYCSSYVPDFVLQGIGNDERLRQCLVSDLSHAVQATPERLIMHLIEEHSIVDPTYIEDFLLTYRTFLPSPLDVGTKLLEWFKIDSLRDKHPVLDEPIAEAVCIIADMDKWTVQVASSQRRMTDNKLGKEVLVSSLVSNLLHSTLQLYKHNLSPNFCVMHLEDRLQELYFKSKMLSEYLRGQMRVHVKELGVVLGIESSDLPLLAAVASTHSPYVAQILL